MSLTKSRNNPSHSKWTPKHHVNKKPAKVAKQNKCDAHQERVINFSGTLCTKDKCETVLVNVISLADVFL